MISHCSREDTIICSETNVNKMTQLTRVLQNRNFHFLDGSEKKTVRVLSHCEYWWIICSVVDLLSLSPKLTIVIWYGSSSGQEKWAAMRFRDSCIRLAGGDK